MNVAFRWNGRSSGPVWSAIAAGAVRSIIAIGLPWLTVALGFSVARAGAQNAPALTPENLWTFRAFSAPLWSPDGTQLAFTVTQPETNSSTIYVATLNGTLRALNGQAAGQGPTMLSLLPEPWTPNSRALLYLREGNLYRLDVESDRVTALLEFGAASPGYMRQQYFNGPDPVLSPDGTQLAFIRESELWVLDLSVGALRQLTSTHGDGWHNLSPQWSPDGRRILYTAQSIDEQHRVPQTDFAGNVIEVEYRLIGYGRTRVGIIDAEGGETTWLGPVEGETYSLRGGSQVRWSPDGRTVAINRISLDHRARELLLVDPSTGAVRLIWREVVENWISPMAIWISWSPDSQELLFTSERDGWNHVYVIGREGGTPRQLTSGQFTVTSNQVYDRSEVTPEWSPDGTMVYFPSNEVHTGERHLYAVPAEGGAWRRVTALSGVNLSSTLSPDGSHIAYLHSDPTTLPELYVQRIDSGRPTRLTNLAMPEWLEGYVWNEPAIFTYPNPADGVTVTARLYTPRNLDRSRQHPAVVFVHGAGYAQSVFRGWVRMDQAAFNHMLADRGYVVLDVDFRGSAGYGAEFRRDVFDRVGEIDHSDVVAGLDYLRGLGYVDIDRVGIWGHSYGGFMVLAALFHSPKDFAVGVSSAPVTDWERFFYVAPGYNEEHFGFPWENPDGTRYASPLWYADQLERPLLLVSGVQDEMHLDAAALTNELLRLRKAFDWTFYPNEGHGIRDPATREDYFRRIFEYLDQHLQIEAASEGG